MTSSVFLATFHMSSDYWTEWGRDRIFLRPPPSSASQKVLLDSGELGHDCGGLNNMQWQNAFIFYYPDLYFQSHCPIQRYKAVYRSGLFYVQDRKYRRLIRASKAHLWSSSKGPKSQLKEWPNAKNWEI